jgi:hypothetical protein
MALIWRISAAGLPEARNRRFTLGRLKLPVNQSGTFPRTVRYTQDQAGLWNLTTENPVDEQAVCPRADKGEFRVLGRSCRTDSARKASASAIGRA